jgi:hypothetical protein
MRAGLRLVTVLLLVLTLGLHWALLQTVAWTGMLVSYSRGASFQEAVAKTFDGQHPCCLCKAIQNGRAEEKQQQQQTERPGTRLEPGIVWEAPGFIPAGSRQRVDPVDFRAASRQQEPPKPRPRGVIPHCPDRGRVRLAA